MLFGKFSKTWSLAAKNNSGLLVANVAMAIAMLILSYLAFGNRERVILTPPHLDTRVEIAWKSASKEYYEGWGLYIASTIGNVTPRSVSFITDILSPHFDSTIYVPIRTKLLSLLKDPNFTKANTFAYFAPERVTFEPEMNRVFVQGRLNSSTTNIFTDGKEAKSSEAVVYEMDFVMKDGRPVVTRFDSYKGMEPRTQQWLQAHPNADPNNPAAKKNKKKASEIEMVVPEPVVNVTPTDNLKDTAPAPTESTAKINDNLPVNASAAASKK